MMSEPDTEPFPDGAHRARYVLLDERGWIRGHADSLHVARERREELDTDRTVHVVREKRQPAADGGERDAPRCAGVRDGAVDGGHEPLEMVLREDEITDTTLYQCPGCGAVVCP